MKVSIVIPAHNEEKRISRTLTRYCKFFENVKSTENIETNFIVVLNGCKDKTYEIAHKIKEKFNSIRILNLKKSGKGLAIKEGFKCALQDKNDLIGFVDADMATKPKYFYELIKNIKHEDAIIGSRYMKGAVVTPKRPLIKSWGRKIVFNPLIRLMLGMKYKDFQCGAKLFKKSVLQKILPHLTIKQWAFDIELLYLCKKNGFYVREAPTIWHDQDHSKFKLFGPGMKMLSAIIKLRLKHSRLKKTINKT